MHRFAVLLSALALVLAVPWAAASQPTQPQPQPPGQPQPLSSQSPDWVERPLSLSEAVELGIRRNLDVEVARFAPPIADFEHSAAWGLYEPSLFGDFNYASTESPIASALQDSSRLVERQTDGSAGVFGLIPKLGWSYQVGYEGQRLQTTSSIQDLSPEYRASLTASGTLPLLKGFLWGREWVQVKLSGIGSDIALEEFRQRLMDTVRAIEDAYWNLAAEQQAVEVAIKSLETSKALLEQTEAQYEVGVVSKVEVTESEAGVAQREFELIRTENSRDRAEDTLIDLALGSELEPSTAMRIKVTDSPERYIVFDTDAEVSAQRAFELRPELKVARQQTEQARINLKFAKNERLPQLDLVARYGYAGLSGKTNPQPPIFGGQSVTVGQTATPVFRQGADGSLRPDTVTTDVTVPVVDQQGNFVREPIPIDRSYWATDDDFFSADGAKQWAAGAVVTIPIGNTTGRSNVSARQLELRRAKAATRRLEQNIILEVRDAVRNLRSSLEGIQAAERRRDAATEQLRAEQIRLEHGESTPFEVLQREEDLVEAELQRITALQVYHNSTTGLVRAQGTILRDRGVVVEEALPLR